MTETIIILKRNLAGAVTWQYSGHILRRGPGYLVLEALFNLPDMPFMGISLKRGDRFVEAYYTDRWYSIFEIHDRDDDRLKGWYCNFGRPAVMEDEGILSYVDLALDLWVAPDGTQTVLDEDEFAALNPDAKTRQKVLAALDELQNLFRDDRKPGF